MGSLTISQFLAICLSVIGVLGLLVLQRMPADRPVRCSGSRRRKPRQREEVPGGGEISALGRCRAGYARLRAPAFL